MEQPETIHVTMAIDGGYEMPLGVALLSLAESQSAAGVPCHVSVLGSGLDVEKCRAIEDDVAGRIGLDWVTVDLDRLTGAYYNEVLSPATLFRLLMPELLPADRARTIYLDSDTVVRRSLAELWATNIGDSVVAAVRDAGIPFAAGPFGTSWRDLGMAPDSSYFNAGVLLVPLDRWRTEGLATSALELLRRKELPWGDQDALNVTAQGRWQELPRRWNVQSDDAGERSMAWALSREDVESAVKDPAIIHYTGTLKPWAGGVDHPFAQEWFDVLARSSWARWEPERPSLTKRVRGRLGRSARVLVYGAP